MSASELFQLALCVVTFILLVVQVWLNVSLGLIAISLGSFIICVFCYWLVRGIRKNA